MTALAFPQQWQILQNKIEVTQLLQGRVTATVTLGTDNTGRGGATSLRLARPASSTPGMLCEIRLLESKESPHLYISLLITFRYSPVGIKKGCHNFLRITGSSLPPTA